MFVKQLIDTEHTFFFLNMCRMNREELGLKSSVSRQLQLF